jgi:hypothetical protein
MTKPKQKKTSTEKVLSPESLATVRGGQAQDSLWIGNAFAGAKASAEAQ